MLKVIKASSAGFCFGVKRAVEGSLTLAEKSEKPIYTYGKLIHNDQEVERLKKNGIIPRDEISDLQNEKVIIRTHGISVAEFDQIESKNNSVSDFTCPFVKKLQQYANQYYLQGYQVLIFGQSDHPEIIGVKGWTDNTAIIIDGPAAIQSLDFLSEKICLLSQTTEREENFSLVAELIKARVPETLVINTICKATKTRQDETMELAKEVDTMIIVGGKESSNTKKLFQVAKSVNNNTFIIEKALDLDKKWFETSNVAGVSAGASTPDWIIEEVIKEMEEMKETMEMAEAVESKKSPRKGAIVQGKVVQVEAERAFIDVGGKTEAILEPGEVSFRNPVDLTTAITVGDEFMVKVIDIENENGEMRVSKRRAEEKEAIDKLLAAKENQEIIKAEVYEAVKGGILVDVGIRGFIPASLVDVGFIEDLNQFVGQEIEVMVEEVDLENRKYILSRKAVIDKELEKVWETLQEGQTITGKVKKLVDFGAFIDLGGIEGLLHISEMGWGKVEKSSDVLEEGQELEVFLLSVNKETSKIALSLKKLKADPWSLVEQNYKPGDIITGKVVRDAQFGAFVEVEPGLDGLVHISQIAWERVEKVADALAIGDQVQVKIMDIDAANKKLNLSIKETLDRPQRAERPQREEKPKTERAFADKKESRKPRADKRPAKQEAETETIMDDKGPTGINIGEAFADVFKDLKFKD